MAQQLYYVKDTIFGDGFRISKIKAFNQKAANGVENYLRNRKHEIYGSAAAYSQGSRNMRPPADLDVAVDNVDKSANAFSSILRNSGYQTRVHYYPEYKAAQIEYKTRAGWEVIIDVQPLAKHQSEVREFTGAAPVPPRRDPVSGLYIQNPSDQLRRKHSAVLNPEMPEHRKQKDSFDYVNLVNDMLVSESVKRDANILSGRVSWNDIMNTPMKPDNAWAISERVEREKGLDEHALDNAVKPPLTYGEKRRIVRYMANHPHIHPDDINITKGGKIFVVNRRGDNKR